MDELARQKLHQELDRILDRREELEKQYPFNALLGATPTDRNPVGSPGQITAARLFGDAVALASTTLGISVQQVALAAGYEREVDQRPILKRWLNMLVPLIYSPPSFSIVSASRKELSVFDALNALSALDAGEVMPLLRPYTGRNRRKNHWSLAKAKLGALIWKKRLRVLGYPEKDASFRITVAFSEQWDTIRRWQTQCESILGNPMVEAALDFAGSAGDPYVEKPTGMFGAMKSLDPLKALEMAGADYQTQKRRAAELSPRKGKHGPDE